VHGERKETEEEETVGMETVTRGKGLRTLGNEEEQKLKSEEREEVQKREMNERRNGKKQSKGRTGLAGDTRQARLKDWEVADKERKSAALHSSKNRQNHTRQLA